MMILKVKLRIINLLKITIRPVLNRFRILDSYFLINIIFHLSSYEAFRCAEAYSRFGSRFPVKIVKGGFLDFSKKFPFLRSLECLIKPREKSAVIQVIIMINYIYNICINNVWIN